MSDNILNVLLEDWKWVELGDVCDIYQGYGFPKNIQGTTNGDYPFHKVGDILKNIKAGFKYLELCDNSIDKNALAKLKAKLYPVNTVVFAKIGEALKLNRRAIIKEQGIVDNNAIGLKAKERLCKDLFLYYFLLTVKLEDYSRATTVPSVRKSDIEQVVCPLAPLEIQQKIVANIEELFSTLDKGTDELHTAQKALKVYRQAVLKWAFEGKLMNECVDRREDNLPEEWKRVDLDKVSNVSGGISKTPKRNGLPIIRAFLRVANVYLNQLDLSEIHTIGLSESEVGRVTLLKDDLLFVEGNGSIEQIGRVALWTGEIENCVHQNHLIKSRLTKEILPKYALYFFYSKEGRDKIKLQAQSTSGLHTLSISKISKLTLPLPPLPEQHQIVQEIESRLSVCNQIETTIANNLQGVAALRQSILQKAFTGKLIE